MNKRTSWSVVVQHFMLLRHASHPWKEFQHTSASRGLCSGLCPLEID